MSPFALEDLDQKQSSSFVSSSFYQVMFPIFIYYKVVVAYFQWKWSNLILFEFLIGLFEVQTCVFDQCHFRPQIFVLPK